MHRQPHHQKVAAGLRADLHAHTNASPDCRTSVRALLRAAKQAGLQVVAITDHDSIASHAEALKLAARYNLQVVPGVEITAEGGTHVLAYFIRQLPPTKKLPALLDWIRAQGGVSCLPHLYRSDTGLLYNHTEKGQFTAKEIDTILEKVDLIETLNFKSAFRGETDAAAIVKKYRKPVLANTDSHYDLEVGKAFTTFALPAHAPLTPEALKHAARTLMIHPIIHPAPKRTLPLANYEPKEQKVATMKRFLGPLVPALGKVLYAWQDLARYRAKAGQIAKLLEDSPAPKPYKTEGA